MSIITASRYHDISCGHRVYGHENKCANLHGHNYRVHFGCEAAKLDGVGRVIDFSVMKAKLCMWLEENWDHRFLAWEHDTLMQLLAAHEGDLDDDSSEFDHFVKNSMVWVPFNPTAENMAQYLLTVVGPAQLQGTSVRLVAVRIDETRKCSASAFSEV